jgi:hypothetical protein
VPTQEISCSETRDLIAAQASTLWECAPGIGGISIDTPLLYDDGTGASVFVERSADGSYVVSDDGEAVQMLWASGVELSFDKKSLADATLRILRHSCVYGVAFSGGRLWAECAEENLYDTVLAVVESSRRMVRFGSPSHQGERFDSVTDAAQMLRSVGANPAIREDVKGFASTHRFDLAMRARRSRALINVHRLTVDSSRVLRSIKLSAYSFNDLDRNARMVGYDTSRYIFFDDRLGAGDEQRPELTDQHLETMLKEQVRPLLFVENRGDILELGRLYAQ